METHLVLYREKHNNLKDLFPSWGEEGADDDMPLTSIRGVSLAVKELVSLEHVHSFCYAGGSRHAQNETKRGGA